MQAVAQEHAALIEVLHSAYERESNTYARYAEFAEKADGEGWHGVASLFRAVARAEQINAENHGRILRQTGGPMGFIERPVDVRNTLDNLRAALADERFEIDSTYPAFAEQAGAHHDAAVLRTFTLALEADKTHARLFNEAIALVEIEDEDAWVTMRRDFYVCPECGHTSETRNEHEMCPVCNCAWVRFECCD